MNLERTGKLTYVSEDEHERHHLARKGTRRPGSTTL